MFPQLGAPVGFIAANGLFLLLGLGLSDADFAAWGWRIPFLLSAVLVGLGLWVRFKIGETPDFAEALEKEAPVAVPLGELFRHHLVATLAGTFAVVACFAIFYLATRSEEHTSELQSLMRISSAVFCLQKKNKKTK